MGKRIGYARVSTTDQDLSVQRDALSKAGVDVIFEERVTGTIRDGRTELQKALSILGEDDAIVITRLDRLGRSLRDLANIAAEIEEAGASLVVTEQSVDTSTSAGRAFFGMLAVFAAFETDVRRERQMEGIAKAKADGVYKGRPASIDRDAIFELAAGGAGATKISRELSISRSHVYRILKESQTADAT